MSFSRVIVVIFILICFVCCKGKPARVADQSEYYLIEDSTLVLSADEIWKRFSTTEIKAYTGHAFNPGFTRSFYWLIANVPPHHEHHTLQIGNAHLNIVEFYEVQNGKPVLINQTGDHTPFDSRLIPVAEFAIPVKGNFYLIKLDKVNESLQASFQVIPTSLFWQEQNRETALVAVITGVIVLLIIFGLFLALITRERIYLFYMLYVGTGWLWVLANFGYGYQYLWPDFPWFASRARPVFAMITLGFSVQFIVSYVGKAPLRWQRVVFNLVIILSVVVTLIFLLPIDMLRSNTALYYLQRVIPSTTLLFILIVFYVLIQKAFQGNNMARFYLTGIFLLLAGSAIQAIHYANVIDFSGSVLEKYAMAMGFVAESIVITFGLAYRFNNYRLERESIFMTLNEQQVKHTQTIIKTQENERRIIADQLHDVAGSLLSAAKLNLSSIREKELIPATSAKNKLQQAEDAVTSIAEILRNLSHAISPVMLEQVGFKKAVEKVVSIFNTSGKITIELDVTGFDKEDPAMHEKYTIIYGILYELINNVVKHANASHALIQLVEHEDSIVLVIEDDGDGLEFSGSQVKSTHGLAAIKSKIHYLNGSIQFDSSDSKGLIVIIEVPKKS